MRVVLGLSLLPGPFPVGWRHQEKGQGDKGTRELATSLVGPAGFRRKLLISFSRVYLTYL